MLEKKIIIKNERGIHARPAGILAKAAQKYKSDISLEKNGNEYNCKSIMSILSMGIRMNEEIRLSACGLDEDEAFKELQSLLENSSDI